MNYKIYSLYFLVAFLLTSCSSKHQLLYLSDYNKYSQKNIEHSSVLVSKKTSYIQSGDILKIEVSTLVAEATAIFNKNSNKLQNNTNLQTLLLEGYRVNDMLEINYPVLGVINVENLSLHDLEDKITNLLVDEGHLQNPTINISRLNFKFTVMGEVNQPGTFSTLDENINLFQAIGHAGDLTINGKRKKIILLRQDKGVQKIYNVDLTKSDIMRRPYFYIHNNDVIIVEPNFSKVKSAGFIGSPASIASISSLLLSITLLLINN
ncbi:polysaccharide biosynthesis/export family protein [Flavobacteriales bacterium]|nr:polysaccharide biosynthesis/export family protein [Flavobacteriales bacterium]